MEESKQSLNDRLRKKRSSPKHKSTSVSKPASSQLDSELQLQLKTTQESLQRLMAEFDNFRKRTDKEKINLYGNAVAEVIEKILPVMDNLERALNSITDTESNYYKGFEMILKQFKTVIIDLGIEEIEVNPHDVFNHEIHFAVAQVQDENFMSNEIFDELEKGYKYKDKVVRYSKVRVVE